MIPSRAYRGAAPRAFSALTSEGVRCYSCSFTFLGPCPKAHYTMVPATVAVEVEVTLVGGRLDGHRVRMGAAVADS